VEYSGAGRIRRIKPYLHWFPMAVGIALLGLTVFVSNQPLYLQRFILASGIIVSLLSALAISICMIGIRHTRSAAKVQSELAREAASRELSMVFENAREGIARLDGDGRYLSTNQAYTSMLGYEPGELIGRHWEMTVHEEDRERIAAAYRQMLATGTGEAEARGTCRDGAIIQKHVHLVSIGEPDGAAHGYYCFCRDITGRKRAEEELRGFNARLEASNQDLAEFAAAASHDMQEPLRKIQAFGDMLRASCEGRLEPEGLQYLARMQDAAGRMRTLVRDLLVLSRVTRDDSKRVEVPLDQTIQEVLSDLEVSLLQVQGKVEIGELPKIDADPTQMRQLFQNLIGNALKFHRKGDPPVVEISGKTGNDGRYRISVRDNGVGFEEQYAEQIFAPFRRLHGRGEYEGTGLGLAVCRRIVERHGGSISARSLPGKGSTFLIELPAMPAKATPKRGNP